MVLPRIRYALRQHPKVGGRGGPARFRDREKSESEDFSTFQGMFKSARVLSQTKLHDMVGIPSDS